MQLIRENNEIIKDLENKSIDLALKWCIDNKSKLSKLNSSFEFNLLFQKFIEIVRSG
jgi:hypothetical protein